MQIFSFVAKLHLGIQFDSNNEVHYKFNELMTFFYHCEATIVLVTFSQKITRNKRAIFVQLPKKSEFLFGVFFCSEILLTKKICTFALATLQYIS